MRATGLALVTDSGQPKLEINSKDLIHVLLMDDNEQFTTPLKQQLERWGYSVDVAENPIKANELLAHNTYQVIIADILFPEDFISGDEFLLQNRDAVRNATTIAITADRENVTYKDELDKLGVITIVKGEHIPKLKAITERALGSLTEELNRAIVCIVTGRRPTSTASPVTEKATERLRSVLIRWLKEMGEPQKKSILYKGRLYSPEDLVSEVEDGTEVGEAHMNMMMNLFEETFGVNENYETELAEPAQLA